MKINLPSPQSALGQLIDSRWVAELLNDLNAVPQIEQAIEKATANLNATQLIKSSFTAARVYGVTGEQLVLLRASKLPEGGVHSVIVFNFGRVEDLKGGR